METPNLFHTGEYGIIEPGHLYCNSIVLNKLLWLLFYQFFRAPALIQSIQ